ncbi:MAG TPA: RNA polymerase sigma factor [Solirubrobacterales bacterium]|nr:RNA polymerase sigma factor [Solirubrobacterales bacterium]
MARSGNPGAFEAIVDRYQGRLLGFSRQMLGSTEDAEDVLQEVFVNAYRAMLADEREINLRPWLYRIARNRCLNHLRKPTADAQESMDMVPEVEAASTAEKVHNREEFRQLLTDVGKLPETQRSALLLREMDAMSYEEIAQAMETSVPSVKSLLVRARISLAEASQARQLTCGEVRIDLAEAAEGLRKLSGPVRRHVRDCEECSDFRSQLRSNDKVLAALVPVSPLVAFKGFIATKLGLGGGAGAGGAATATGAGATGAGAVGGVGAALTTGGAAGGLGAVGGAIGTKAVAGVVTAAVITAGAVEVKQQTEHPQASPPATISRSVEQSPPIAVAPAHSAVAVQPAATEVEPAPLPVEPAPVEASVPEEVVVEPPPAAAETEGATGGSEAPEATPDEAAAIDGATPSASIAGAPAGAGTGTVVVTVGGSTSSPEPAPAAAPAPPVETAPPPAPPVESPAPVEETPPASPDSGEAPPAS